MARQPSIQQIINSLPPGTTPQTVIPEGPHAGKTVGQRLQEIQQGQQQWQQYTTGQEMTIDDALSMAVNSPNPQNFVVPYGPFAGMNTQQLVEARKQQAQYLQDAGVIEKPEKGLSTGAQIALGIGAPIATYAGQQYVSGLIGGAKPAATGLATTGTTGTAGAASTASTAGSAGTTGASTAGSSLAGGSTGAAPSAPVVVGQTGTTGGSTLGSTLSSALPWLGVAGMGYYTGTQLKQAAKELESSSSSGQGAYRAAAMSNLLTMWVPPVTDALGIQIKSGKGKDQQERDNYRKFIQTNANGEIYRKDAPHLIGLADGSNWDMRQHKGGSYNIDWENANEDAIGKLDPLVHTMLGSSVGDKRGWTVGELYNAATSGGDVNANIRNFYDKAGFTRDTIYQAIDQDATLDQDRKNAYKAAIDSLYGVTNPNAPKADPLKVVQEAKEAPKPQAPKPVVDPSLDPLVNAVVTAEPRRNEGRPAPVFGASYEPSIRNAGRPAPGMTPIPEDTRKRQARGWGYYG